MENSDLTLHDIHSAYFDWMDEPTKVYEYRKDDVSGQVPTELDILCYQPGEDEIYSDEEYPSLLATAGISLCSMQGPNNYIELLLNVKGRKYTDTLDELSRKLAEFSILPFRHNTHFSSNRLIDGFSFPLFKGMDSVLLTNWGVNLLEYLPCSKRQILLLEVHPVFKCEAEVIEIIGDIEANDRFLAENIDWDVPDRKIAELKAV